jgi:predicted small lipoprotein YifL
MIRLLMILSIASALLAACGTKGDLECPKGTTEHIDKTCAPPGT